MGDIEAAALTSDIARPVFAMKVLGVQGRNVRPRRDLQGPAERRIWNTTAFISLASVGVRYF